MIKISALIAALVLGAAALASPSAEAATTKSTSYQVPSAYFCRGGYSVPSAGFYVTYTYTPGPGFGGTCTRTVTF